MYVKFLSRSIFNFIKLFSYRIAGTVGINTFSSLRKVIVVAEYSHQLYDHTRKILVAGVNEK